MKKIHVLLVSILLVLLSACGDESNPKETQLKQEAEENETYVNIQDVDIKVKENQAIITGKAKASNNEFYYHVEKGDNILKDEEKIQVDGEWGKFEIKVDITSEMKEGEDVVFVKMYNRKEDTIVNPNYIPLDI